MNESVLMEAHACLIQAVSTSNRPHAGAWTRLGAFYDVVHDTPAASACFEAGMSADGSHSRFVGSFDFIGPFPIGKSEIDADPVALLGGVYTLRSQTALRIPSELVQGGAITWRTFKASTEGMVTIGFSDINWQQHIQFLSKIEALEFQGWVIGDLFVNVAGTYALHCPGAITMRINGHLHAADVFHRNQLMAVEYLARGVHTVATRLRGKVTSTFGCHLKLISSETQLRAHSSIPPTLKPHLIAYPPRLKPDLVSFIDGSTLLFGDYISLPVLNTHLSYLSSIAINIANDGRSPVVLGVHPDAPFLPGIAPGQLIALPLRIRLRPRDACYLNVHPDTDAHVEHCDDMHWSTTMAADVCPARAHITVNAVDENGVNVASAPILLELRCRKALEPFVFTFLDHDGSISSAAVVLPLYSKRSAALSPLASVPVVLSLHGTGVSAQAQAEAYKMKSSKDKDYTFGVQNAWLLCPDRHGAHNWEYTGHWTAMWAVSALSSMLGGAFKSSSLSQTSTIASAYGNNIRLARQASSMSPAAWLLEHRSSAECQSARHSAACVPLLDTMRVVFTGHSMGGHGALHAAVHEAGCAIGFIPIAAWIDKEHYGDANAWMNLDIQNSYTDPLAAATMQSAVLEHTSDLFLSNLVDIRTHIRVGQLDGTVPPWYSRRLHRLLTVHNITTSTLEELPGKEHWFWDTLVPNDGGVVNDAQLRSVYSTMITSQPTTNRCNFTVTSSNPATFGAVRGVHILQLLKPFQLSKISIASTDDACMVFATSNVRRFRLYPHESPRLHANCMMLDTQRQHTVENVLTWEMRLASDAYGLLERGPHNYGPFRQVSASPFLIVIGTQGSQQLTEGIMRFAQYLANTHDMTTDTAVWIVNDTHALSKDFEDYNKLFIGGPTHNAASAAYTLPSPNCPRFPVSFYNTSFVIGEQQYTAPGIGTLFTFGFTPANERPRIHAMLSFTDMEGLRALLALAIPTIPPMARAPFSNSIPDYVVVSSDIHALGLGGVLQTGYWGNLWEWRRELEYSVS